VRYAARIEAKVDELLTAGGASLQSSSLKRHP
jgi:hypothetical protein